MKAERNLTIPFKHLKAATWKRILNYFFYSTWKRGTGTGSHREADFCHPETYTLYQLEPHERKQETLSFPLLEEFTKIRCL